MKFAVIPNTKSSQVLLKINEKKDETPDVLFAQGYYGKAIDKINLLLKSKPNDHKILFLKGRSQLMLNQFESASSTFLDALAIESKSDYFNGLGFAYSKLKQINMSLAAYNKSISLDNKNSYAYFHSGLLLENSGNFKVMNYNVRLFNLYDWIREKGVETKIIDLIKAKGLENHIFAYGSCLDIFNILSHSNKFESDLKNSEILEPLEQLEFKLKPEMGKWTKLSVIVRIFHRRENEPSFVQVEFHVSL